MEILATYSNYQQFKQALDIEMQKTIEGFVKIGFLLNYATETNIVTEGGYENVNDFAKAEYGIDATQVSRFVNIYRRFGELGWPRLKTQYMNHGVAKLGIMLTLPDFLNEEISSEYSKTEINAIKHEYEAEQQVSDIEVAIERKDMEDSIQYTLPEGLKQAVYQLIHDEPELYVRIYSAIELEDLKEIMAPMGEHSYFVRIKGVGRLAIFVRANADVTVTNLREGSKESYEWQQLFDVLKEYFAMGENAKDSWSNVFQEPYPEMTKPESVKTTEKPVEKAKKPDKDNVKKEKPKKESKVKVVETKAKEKTVTNCHVLDENTAIETYTNSGQLEEQLPGQKSIMDYPDYLPDSMKEDKQEVLEGEEEKVKEATNTDNDNVQQSSEGMKVEYIAPVQSNDKANTIRGYKAGIRAALTIMEDKYEAEDWSSIYVKASDIAFRAKKIMELEGKK